MHFSELANFRHSVRSYLDRPVEVALIEQCLESARVAPSACNSQPWRFVVVMDKRLKEAVAACAMSPGIQINRFVPQAPVILVVVVEKSNTAAKFGGMVKGKAFNWMDVSIAAEHFCLQAAELGLGTCLLGWFNERKLKKILKIPLMKRVALMITLGYPAGDSPAGKRRKSMDEIRWYNVWGEKAEPGSS